MECAPAANGAWIPFSPSWRKQRRDERAALLVGAALVNLFAGWTEWCHRRVDSIHPLDGDHGRRKQSIDCTPPKDPRLLLNAGHRHEAHLQPYHGQMILPIALVEKAALRHFDARDATGTPLPILNSEQIAELELDMLQFMLSVDKVTVLPGWRAHLRGLLGSGEHDRASAKVERLLREGIWGKVRIWREGDEPKDFTKDMLRNFASHFLMLATLDSRSAGSRQVLKYSYHWELDKATIRERLQAPFLAIGALRRIPIAAEQPAAARSYHMEFHTPDEFECSALVLPAADDSATVTDGHIDATNKPMAHAHATYVDEPSDDPYVMVRLPSRGLWLATTLAVVFTASILGGIQFWDYAKSVWTNAPEAAAALLIAAPAVFFGLIASGREHRLARHALGFLRGLLFVCTASLFVLATSIVGQLDGEIFSVPLFDILLFVLFWWHALFAVFLVGGRAWFAVALGKAIKQLPNVRPAA